MTFNLVAIHLQEDIERVFLLLWQLQDSPQPQVSPRQNVSLINIVHYSLVFKQVNA